MQTSAPKIIRLRRSDPPIRQLVNLESAVRATPAPTPTIQPPRISPAQVSVPQISTAPVTPPATKPPAEKKVFIAEHPLAQHALMNLRNKHTTVSEFRQNSQQLLVLLTVEALRSLPTRDDMVQTHSTTHTGPVVAKPVILLSVSREGLGLAHKTAEIVPNLLIGSISLDRSNETLGVEPKLHLNNAPALGDARIILFVPVVATGASASQAVKFVRKAGATDITLLSFLVSFQGLSRLQTTMPDLNFWTAGIDSDWDSKRGPLPGLGKFAERLYG